MYKVANFVHLFSDTGAFIFDDFNLKTDKFLATTYKICESILPCQ